MQKKINPCIVLRLTSYSVLPLFRFVARFACVASFNWRPGGSREVLVGVSELGFDFCLILLTVASCVCKTTSFRLIVRFNRGMILY